MDKITQLNERQAFLINEKEDFESRFLCENTDSWKQMFVDRIERINNEIWEIKKQIEDIMEHKLNPLNNEVVFIWNDKVRFDRYETSEIIREVWDNIYNLLKKIDINKLPDLIKEIKEDDKNKKYRTEFMEKDWKYRFKIKLV